MTVNKLTPHKAPFEPLSRAVLQDPILSIEARGLWAMMMSMPPDWEFNYTWMQQNAGIGRDKRRSLLRELQDAGLVSIERRRDEGDRTFLPGDHITVYPSAGYPGPGSQGLDPRAWKTEPTEDTPTEQTATETTEHTCASERLVLIEEDLIEALSTESFEEFWECYGRKVGKKAARGQWARHVVGKVDAAMVVAAAGRYAAATPVKYRKHPERWLRDHRWEDEDVASVGNADRWAVWDQIQDDIDAANRQGATLQLTEGGSDAETQP